MALKFSIPAIIKMGTGMAVTLDLVTRYFVMTDVVYPSIKKDIQARIDEGTLERKLEKDDYEYVNKSDAISFFFVGGERVDYRVGLEITQEDYAHAVTQLDELLLRSKDDREPSDNEVEEPTA